MKIISKLYAYSPSFVQNLGISFYSFLEHKKRYGKTPSYLKNCLSTEENLESVVQERLEYILNKCIPKCFYYSNLLKKYKIDLKVVTPSNLGEYFPILEKSSISGKEQDFISDKNNDHIFTSGTTGSPLKITYNREARGVNYYFFDQLLRTKGCNYKSRKIVFAGRNILGGNNKNIFWRNDYFNNTLYMSSYHLSNKTIPYYIDKLKKWNPSFIDSYPSAIGQIADYCIKNKFTLKSSLNLKFILTSSEVLSDKTRQRLIEVFGCPVIDQYGNTEMTVFAYKVDKYFYFNPLYSIVELIPTGTSNIFEVISTGLINDTMPLIRYRTGDSVQVDDPTNPYNTISYILGRTDDLIVTTDGKKIGRMDPVFKGVEGIQEAQIIQNKLDEIVVLIVGDQQNGRRLDPEILISNIKERTNLNMKVYIQQVDEIKKSKSGKFRSVISNLKQ